MTGSVLALRLDPTSSLNLQASILLTFDKQSVPSIFIFFFFPVMDNRTSEPLWMERQEAREQEASSCSGKQTNKKTGKAIFRLKEEHKNNISDSCRWKRFLFYF